MATILSQFSETFSALADAKLSNYQEGLQLRSEKQSAETAAESDHQDMLQGPASAAFKLYKGFHNSRNNSFRQNISNKAILQL
jgi:hypothetical protein